LDPFTGKKVYVATSPEEKRAQRALLGKAPGNHRKKKSGRKK
jgi:hypothetical protein